MRYRFDSAMSRGPFVVIAYLAALSVAIMVFAALVAVLFGMAFAGGNDDGPIEAFWQALLRTVDAGTSAADSAWPERPLSLIVTEIGSAARRARVGPAVEITVVADKLKKK